MPDETRVLVSIVVQYQCDLPITTSSQKFSQVLQPSFIFCVKPSFRRRVDINDSYQLYLILSQYLLQYCMAFWATYLFTRHDWHNNFAYTLGITCNMTRKVSHIIHSHDTLLSSCGAADSATKGNGLAGRSTMEGSKD